MADGEGIKGLTERQERFCRFIIEGMPQREAYKAAGYKSDSPEAQDANASRLISSDKIAARIAELRKPILEKLEITLSTVTDMLRDDRELARTLNQSSAAVSATLGIAKLHGLIVEKRENLNRNVNDTSELTREELLRLARAGREGTVATGSGEGKPDRVHAVH